jgi:branched-chain amino acid transport system substrate-binding protein
MEANRASSSDEQPDEGAVTPSRRRVLAAAGGTALTAALAGCNALLGGDDDGDQNRSTPGDVPDEPIEAGMQVFLEGPAAAFGVPTRRGAEVAIQRVNDAGGVAGREINLEVVHESEVVSTYTQFVDEGKDVTFGPISSGSYEALAPEVESQGVINICPAGTTTTIFEEIVTDPTYNFRVANYAVMDSATAAVDAFNRFDNVETVAGINPNYTGGRNGMNFFETAIKQLGDVDVVYTGWPDLGTDDYSTHISEVNNQEPDVTFTIVWGGDAVTFMNQAKANNLFENTNIVGLYIYGQLNQLDPGTVEGTDVVSATREFYWGHPPQNRYDPMRELIRVAREEYDTYPSFPFMEGYMAVTAWATAVQKAVNIYGGWPSQEQIAASLEGHGYYTPSGYHTIRREDHQGMNNQYFGRMSTSADADVPVLEDLAVYGPEEVAPPPGVNSLDWVKDWQ